MAMPLQSPLLLTDMVWCCLLCELKFQYDQHPNVGADRDAATPRLFVWSDDGIAGTAGVNAGMPLNIPSYTVVEVLTSDGAAGETGETNLGTLYNVPTDPNDQEANCHAMHAQEASSNNAEC